MLAFGMPYLNINGYRFFEISDLEASRLRLLSFLEDSGIKGTVIIGTEGINLALCGEEARLVAFEQFIFEKLSFPRFELKRSWSEKIPHKKMLVKIRSEICTLKYFGIDPQNRPAPYIEPKELKLWLDERRDFVLLDTRKEFEFRLGSFETAINLGGKHFADFPQEVDSLPAEWKDKPIVTFCTGGIRCEKGAPMMVAKGFANVFQLKGGILNYFQECSGEHWRGECFVFDHRAAIKPSLEPVEFMNCRICGGAYSMRDLPNNIDGLRMTCPVCMQNVSAAC